MVCFVVCNDGDVKEGSYARSGRAPPVRTAEGALGREKVDPGFGEAGKLAPGSGEVGKVAPGLGEAGNEGKRLTPGFGEEGRPTRGAVDRSETAETGSASVGAWDVLRE